ncbi:MAG TPA: hypothetical protein VNK43_05425 [Gemmatimonadales bacterium]|nr:hypothetical protein [Gemmatimonadales bacterium]
MAEAKFVELVTAAYHYLTARQDHLRAEYRLSVHERWDWDEDRSAVVFSTGGAVRVVARAQLVGSVSRKSGTWLWSWANDSIEPRHRRDMDEIRRYGEHHGIWQLTTPRWEADEVDGWEMTSIAAYVLQAKGAYRMPYEHLYTFAIFDRIEWAP